MRPLKVPEAEIRYAAKTGFLTKRIWEDFFAGDIPGWKRRRLWRCLAVRGFFRPHPSSLAKQVLILNRKSPMVFKLVGDEISSPPFVSQLEHDETVARILLDLKKAGVIQSFTTEMELKREIKEKQRYDGSVKMKYPDAIIEVSGPMTKIKVALELELTRKDPKRYRQCLNTYAARREVSQVVFIARANAVFDSLRRAMRETYYPDWERPIGFSPLEEWKRNPAEAAICFSETQTSLRSIHKKMNS